MRIYQSGLGNGYWNKIMGLWMKIFKVIRKTTACEIWEVASTRERSYKTCIFLNVCNLFKIRIKMYYMIYTRLSTVPASCHITRTVSTTSTYPEVIYKYIHEYRTKILKSLPQTKNTRCFSADLKQRCTRRIKNFYKVSHNGKILAKAGN